MIDRKYFYEIVRAKFESLRQAQVNGFETILNEWESQCLQDLRWLAYMLATTWHETARTMQPIEEYGKGKGKPYGKPDAITGHAYYGRGYVQLTWKYNYQKMSKILGVDLVSIPSLALDPTIATKILFEGMTKGKSFAGDFTGKHLGNFFNKTTEDWVNARRIINGLDKAHLIASYGKSFYSALNKAV